MTHTVWVPVSMDGTPPTTEVLGLDYWIDVDQMIGFYNEGDFKHIASVFTGAPDSGTWTTAGPGWVEW